MQYLVLWGSGIVFFLKIKSDQILDCQPQRFIYVHMQQVLFNTKIPSLCGPIQPLWGFGVPASQPACLRICVVFEVIVVVHSFFSHVRQHVYPEYRKCWSQAAWLAGWLDGLVGSLVGIHCLLKADTQFFSFLSSFFSWLGISHTFFSTNINFYTEIITYMHVCIFCIQIFFTTFSLLFDGRFAVFLFFINKFSNLFVSSIRTPKKLRSCFVNYFFRGKISYFSLDCKNLQKKEIFSQ